jgi:selenocysteine lyase/cysteine desulfurase
MMNYAQSSLLRSFSANPSDFLALPVGSGSTGAIEKTVRILQNHLKNGSIAIYVSPYEHHSNILPWIQFFGNVNVLAGDE